jgi:hypothetical protein
MADIQKVRPDKPFVQGGFLGLPKAANSDSNNETQYNIQYDNMLAISGVLHRIHPSGSNH